jgi:hypothetical protein
LLIYLACCLAAMRRAPAKPGEPGAPAPSAPEPRGTAPGRLLVPLLTAGAIGVLFLGLERREAVFGMIGIGAGLGLYLLARLGRRALTTKEAS